MRINQPTMDKQILTLSLAKLFAAFLQTIQHRIQTREAGMEFLWLLENYFELGSFTVPTPWIRCKKWSRPAQNMSEKITEFAKQKSGGRWLPNENFTSSRCTTHSKITTPSDALEKANPNDDRIFVISGHMIQESKSMEQNAIRSGSPMRWLRKPAAKLELHVLAKKEFRYQPFVAFYSERRLKRCHLLDDKAKKCWT